MKPLKFSFIATICAGIYFYYNKNTELLIIIALLILMYLEKYTSKSIDIEHFDSNEAVQNLASMYNSDKITVKNLEVTGDVNIKGNTNITGNTTLTGNANITKAIIGKWDIRDDKIGINGRGDLWLNETSLFDFRGYNNAEYRNIGCKKLNATEIIESPKAKIDLVGLKSHVDGSKRCKSSGGSNLVWCYEDWAKTSIVPL